MNQSLHKAFVIDETSNEMLYFLTLASPIPSPLIEVVGSLPAMGPYPVPADDEDFWRYVLRDMALNLQKNNNFEHVVSNYRRLILAEVIRRRWDPKVKVKGVKRGIRPFIKSSGEVADTLITLIIEVFTRVACCGGSQRHAHPALWFREIFLEDEAIGILARTGGQAGKKHYLKKYRKISQALFTHDENNPFLSHHTRFFFNAALRVVGDDSELASGVWLDYVAARRKQTKLLEDEADLLVRTADGKAKKMKQGRKKKSLS